MNYAKFAFSTTLPREISKIYQNEQLLIKRLIKRWSHLAHDIPWTFPGGSLKVLKLGTYRGLSGDSQGTNTKVNDLMKHYALHYISFLVFYRKHKYPKILNRDVHGTSTEPSAEHRTSVGHTKFNSQTH